LLNLNGYGFAISLAYSSGEEGGGGEFLRSKDFYPAVTGLEEGERGSAPCDLDPH
jgi:hypothetical protein